MPFNVPCQPRQWRCPLPIPLLWRSRSGRFIASLLVSWLIAMQGTGAIAQILQPLPIPQPPSQEIRGVWLTTNDTDVVRDHAQLQEAVHQLSRLNFNTVYPVIWNSSYVLYPSAVAQRMGIQPFVRTGLQGQDILADLTTTAHQQGLLVIPWFEFGFMALPNSELAVAHPEWMTQQRDGSQMSLSAAGYVQWLNPFHPEVQQFVTDLVLEVLRQYDVDGIQFDDHTSLPVEFGYDAYTIALYRQETQQAPPANPRDPAWMQWRADKLTAFMAQLHGAIKTQNPDAILSVSPNPYPVAYGSYLQDWLTWVRQGTVDELLVQVYRPDLPGFIEQLERPEIQEARQMIPTAAGVLTGLRNNPVPISFVQAKVRAARNYGLGVSFFYYESLWEQAPEPLADRQAGFQALFPAPARRTPGQTPLYTIPPTL